MGVVETPTSEDHELCSPRDAASALLNPPGYRVVEAVDGPLGVLTTDVGDRFGLDMRKTSEWSGAV